MLKEATSHKPLAWVRSHWGLLLVALLASLIRLASWALDPAVYYFPDSWDYLVPALEPGALVDALHSPYVGWMWSLVLPGNPSEVAVMLFHGTLGVVTACAVYVAAARLCNWIWLNVGASVLVTSVPMQLLHEHALLGETIATAVIAVAAAVTPVPRQSRLAMRMLLFGCLLGLASGIRQAAVLPSIAALALVMMLIARGRERRTGAGWGPSRRTVLIPTVAGALGFFIALWPLLTTFSATFGVFTPNPASGTVLFSRAAAFVQCPLPESGEEPADSVLREICGDPEALRTWGSNQLLWLYEPLSRTMDLPASEFPEVQASLTDASIAGILRSPSDYLQVSIGVLADLFTAPYKDLGQYERGLPAFAPILPDRVTWFNISAEAAGSETSTADGILKQASAGRWSDVLLAIIVGLGVLLPPSAWLVARSRHRLTTAWEVLAPWWVFVTSSVALISLTALPVARYLLLLVPPATVCAIGCVAVVARATPLGDGMSPTPPGQSPTRKLAGT